MKATQKKRYLRYQAAADVAEEVERFLAGGQVLAYQEPFSRRCKRWIGTHPRLSQTIGAAAVFLLTTLLVVGYSVRQSRIAADNLRFYRAADVAKELAFVLEAEARLVTRDLRFISELPPIQGIAETRGLKLAASDSDNEETWKERLSVMMDGLMKNHSSYLAITYLAVEEEIVQLCRTERNPQTASFRRLPADILVSIPRESIVHDVKNMRPGGVLLKTSNRIIKDAPTPFRSPLSISALAATFNAKTGQQFGFFAVQTDLAALIESSMQELRGDDVVVYLLDYEGAILAYYNAGNSDNSRTGEKIERFVPQLSGFFTDQQDRVATDGSTFYATRLVLGEAVADSEAEVGIVVQIID